MLISRSRIGGTRFITDVIYLNITPTYSKFFIFIVGDRSCNFDGEEDGEEFAGGNKQFNDEGKAIDIDCCCSNNLKKLFN